MFKKLRSVYWTLSGFSKRHTLLLFLGVCIGITLSLLAPSLARRLPKPKPRERIAVIARPTLEDIPLSIQKQMSLGLTSIGQKDEALPAIAREYKVEESGKRYRFALRDDITWHDGKPLTAADINYTFSDVTTQVISDYEIVFNLREPFAPFPTVVSKPLLRFEKNKLLPGKIEIIGTGEMRVKSLSRNGPYLSQLLLSGKDGERLYRFYNTQEAAILGFKLGEVDQILELTSPGDLANWPNTIIEESIHSNRYVAVFFNTRDATLSSKGFRQALTYAIPNKSQGGSRTLSPINPQSWAYNPQVKPYDYDVEAAPRLLKEEKEENPDFNPRLELTTTVAYLDLADDIKAEWIKLGIPVTIKVATFLPENFQALLIAQEIPYDPDQYSLWHSTQATNLTGYSSPRIDKLLEDGRQTTDQKERTLIYHEFQRFLVEDSPAAFLFHHKTYTVKRA